MNKIESQLAGKHWIEFKEISPTIRTLYDMLLEASLPGLRENLQKVPGAYEAACEHWLNNSIDEALEHAQRKD